MHKKRISVVSNKKGLQQTSPWLQFVHVVGRESKTTRHPMHNEIVLQMAERGAVC